MKTISITEAELKKIVAFIKKSCTSLIEEVMSQLSGPRGIVKLDPKIV